ncbi:hypothetical protein VTI74DRAFT_804 [Chaetomium olivicolor]
MATGFDVLQQTVNDVLVTTAKAVRASSRDGKVFQAEASAALEMRVCAAVEKFNSVLDDIEMEILRAKAVLLRDLNQLRASRKPPSPVQKPAAPPAQMDVDLESLDAVAKEPFTGLPGPSMSGKQASKPVAPFPNMGFDETSPGMAPAASPKALPRAREAVKPMGNAPAAAVAVVAGQPASVPPKKELKVPPPQAARPGGAATALQTPLGPTTQAKSVSAVPSNSQSATATPNNVQNPPAAAPPAQPSATREGLFTDMTFTLAPPPSDVQAQKQPPQAPQPRRPSQQQPQPPTAGTADPGAGGSADLNTQQSAARPANVANMDLGTQGGKVGNSNGMADVDAKIDTLFDLGPLDQYDLGNGDSSNFNDMFFGNSDNNGGEGEFDDAYFNLNG